MKSERMRELVSKLMEEVEEEEIGISLLTTYHNDKEELSFFSEEDRKRVVESLKMLSEDSKRHKRVLLEIINELTEMADEK